MFLGYLSLFTFFMLLLVCSGNLFIFFVSWEGVGICSYLLINFWNSRVLASQSAIKALLVNKISDLFLLIGILLLVFLYNTVDFSILELCISCSIIYVVCNVSIHITCCLFLFIGVIGKSAQLLLHTWLPDAMEGPTPVSALLHAATMVTAGIFLVLRFSFVFENDMYILQIAGLFGVITIIVSGTIGLFQYDIKKVIAYSTCSQLGYMLVACSSSVYYISLYHFTIHAFFKALLFLLAGCIIHSINNEQDIRKFGGLLKSYPLSYIFFIIGSSALIAEPFLSGFYSKELIIFSLNDVYINSSNFIYWLSLYGAILTVLYSFRSLWLVFFSNFRGYFINVSIINEISYILIYPLSVLVLFSIFSGYIYSGIFRDSSIFCNFYIQSNHILLNHYMYNFNRMEHNYLIIICNFIFIMLFLINVYIDLILSSMKVVIFRYLFVSRWFFDFIYNRVFVSLGMSCSNFIFYDILDKGYIEFLGPFGLYNCIFSRYVNINRLKTYSLYVDILYIFLFIVVLLFSYYYYYYYKYNDVLF